MQKKKVLAVIPARGGSKGVNRKNIRLLDGRPLIWYAIEAARQSEHVDRIIVSSEDQEILEAAAKRDPSLPFPRPAELARDDTPLIAVVLHAYQYFRQRGESYDAVLSVQPTCPFLSGSTVDRVIEIWRETDCDSVTTVAEIENGHPYIAKRLLPGNLMENFCSIPAGAVVGPRQKREKAYFLTGGIYLRNHRLLAGPGLSGHALGRDARAVVVDAVEAVDINQELDLQFAEFLIQSGVAAR